MDDKTKRNELLITLADINNLIEQLESINHHKKEEATDTVSQLRMILKLKY